MMKHVGLILHILFWVKGDVQFFVDATYSSLVGAGDVPDVSLLLLLSDLSGAASADGSGRVSNLSQISGPA